MAVYWYYFFEFSIWVIGIKHGWWDVFTVRDVAENAPEFMGVFAVSVEAVLFEFFVGYYGHAEGLNAIHQLLLLLLRQHFSSILLIPTIQHLPLLIHRQLIKTPKMRHTFLFFIKPSSFHASLALWVVAFTELGEGVVRGAVATAAFLYFFEGLLALFEKFFVVCLGVGLELVEVLLLCFEAKILVGRVGEVLG